MPSTRSTDSARLRRRSAVVADEDDVLEPVRLHAARDVGNQAFIDLLPHADGADRRHVTALLLEIAFRHSLLLDRRHDRTEHRPRQFLEVTRKAIEGAVRRAPRQQRGIVGAGHRAIGRVGVVAQGLDLDVNSAVGVLLIGADMGKGGIAAQHPAGARVHHAAADRGVELKSDLVETLKQCRVPGSAPAI